MKNIITTNEAKEPNKLNVHISDWN